MNQNDLHDEFYDRLTLFFQINTMVFFLFPIAIAVLITFDSTIEVLDFEVAILFLVTVTVLGLTIFFAYACCGNGTVVYLEKAFEFLISVPHGILSVSQTKRVKIWGIRDKRGIPKASLLLYGIILVVNITISCTFRDFSSMRLCSSYVILVMLVSIIAWLFLPKNQLTISLSVLKNVLRIFFVLSVFSYLFFAYLFFAYQVDSISFSENLAFFLIKRLPFLLVSVLFLATLLYGVWCFSFSRNIENLYGAKNGQIFIRRALLLLLLPSVLLSVFSISVVGCGVIRIIEALAINFLASYALLAIILFTAILMVAKNSTVKATLFNIVFICWVVLVLESYLTIQGKQEGNKSFLLKESVGMIELNKKVVGYSARKNSVNHIDGFVDDSLIWTRIATIDSNGQRIMPAYIPGDDKDKSLLFFGCSMTFGLGLSDSGSYPYKVGQLLNHKYKVYNFSLGGYGTHQALSQLEHGVVDSVVAYPPKYVFYAAIPDHVNRVIGIKKWNNYDPKYLLNEKDEAVFQGYFHDQPLTSYETIRNKLYESAIFMNFYGHHGLGRDIDLFISMIDKMYKIIMDKYPGCEFHVLYWDDESSNGAMERFSNSIRSRLDERKNRYQIHYTSDMLSGLREEGPFTDDLIYYPYDFHPKEYVNDTLATYICKEIINE